MEKVTSRIPPIRRLRHPVLRSNVLWIRSDLVPHWHTGCTIGPMGGQVWAPSEPYLVKDLQKGPKSRGSLERGFPVNGGFYPVRYRMEQF